MPTSSQYRDPWDCPDCPQCELEIYVRRRANEHMARWECIKCGAQWADR